jgi:hypothetical protein
MEGFSVGFFPKKSIGKCYTARWKFHSPTRKSPGVVRNVAVVRSRRFGIASGKNEIDGDEMIQTVEGMICEDGTVRLLESVPVTGTKRALVMILDEQPAIIPNETALLSEAALAQDWNRPEEDAAWAHLQPGT